MKSVEDFLSKQIPGQLTVNECIAHAEEAAKTETVVPIESQLTEEDLAVINDEPEHVVSGTPDGIAVYYQWSPRLYRVGTYDPNHPLEAQDIDYTTVPSVTTILNVLDKSGPLIWWGQGIGGIGTLKLQALGQDLSEVATHLEAEDDDAARKSLCSFLTKHRLSTNHVLATASDRGVDAHDAFEKWSTDQTYRPAVGFYPEKVQGYVTGLNLFLDDIAEGGVTDVEAEVMVGSVVHGFAGRFDVRYRLQEPCEVTTRVYPKRKPKREVIEAGRYLKDVKTSKGVYASHGAQLAAYELASAECGYEPTDFRAVIHLTSDGQYELVRTFATGDDFLSILGAYTTMQGSKAWTA